MNTKRFIGRHLVSDFKKWVFGLVVILLSACSNDLQTNGMLPEGKYPVKITTSIKASVTRSTVDDYFSGGEKVAIQAVTKTDDNPSAWNNAQTYIYKEDYNSLVPQNINETHYWISKDETKQIRGWYTPKLSQDSMAIPTSWTVAADQNANDGKGYEESDLLFAPPVEVKYGNDANLTFYHQTAQVIINIKANEIISKTEQIKDIRIGDDNLVLSANYIAPETAESLYGKWILTEKGSIKPYLIDSIGLWGDDDISYKALVIPQNMKGQKFICISTTDGNTYYYTPSGDDANLKAGTTYTYNITVKFGYIDVQVVTSNDWIDDGRVTEVGSNRALLHSYTAKDIKPGDFFYSDDNGNWGIEDGGLRKLYLDGAYEYDETVTPSKNKHYLGIVYYVGDAPLKDNYGLLKKEDFKDGNIHGLVVSLWQIDENDGQPTSSPDKAWSTYWPVSYNSSVSDWLKDSKWSGNVKRPDDFMSLQDTKRFQGYANTLAIKEYDMYLKTKNGTNIIPVVNAINSFNKLDYYKAPLQTTGWFWPSEIELNEMYKCEYYDYVKLSTMDYIDSQIKKLIQSNNNVTGFIQRYWSSTEPTHKGPDNISGRLRLVLAF